MTSTTERDDLTRRVAVCDQCFQASCLQGIFMCENARTAGVADIPYVKLVDMALEHSDYWALVADCTCNREEITTFGRAVPIEVHTRRDEECPNHE